MRRSRELGREREREDVLLFAYVRRFVHSVASDRSSKSSGVTAIFECRSYVQDVHSVIFAQN